jgi:hypothetical protein
MSRRIDIEITSVSGPTATWRAAGAKQPKGSIDIAMLGDTAQVGSVFRAEVEQFMEGVEILSVTSPKGASPVDPRHERIEMLSPQRSGPDVQVTYASKSRPRRDDDRPRRDRPGRDRPVRERRTEPREGSEQRPSRPRSDRPSRERTARPTREKRTGPVPLPVSMVHRNAFLATLSPEQLPVAEQLLRGGMLAVRQAVDEQNKNATAQGRTTVNPEAIDRIADELQRPAALAAWKDRAAGALTAGKELRLRDLRAVVTSARTVSLDDEARLQLKEMQGQLTTRVEALRTEWAGKLDSAIEAGRVVDALQLTARPPEPTTRVSAEAAAKVATLASGALVAEADVSAWCAVVEAAVDSPLRRLVKPSGIPDDDRARALAVKSAGAIPEFAKLLGMKVPPPPPPPARPARPRRAPTTPRSS